MRYSSVMDERARELNLLLAWRDGDRKAGGELVRTHARLLQRFFTNKVSRAEAVDQAAARLPSREIRATTRMRIGRNTVG